MKPSQKYQALIQNSEFSPDAMQQPVVDSLDDLFARLTHSKPSNWWRRWVSANDPVVGVYCWGGVGRGKTLLMDLFYQAISGQVPSQRSHFHSFMNDIHAALAALSNQSDPLRQVASDIAAKTKVLCLDEFVITDIGDAMIMAGLLRTLFEEGVVLVTTSNLAPDKLYSNGLQRARFLPAISLIQQHCDVLNLDGEQDYRLQFLSETNLYSVPHDEVAEALVQRYLREYVTPVQTETRVLRVNGRDLRHQHCAEDTVWFSFEDLCETTRSQSDYLELAKLFNTLILTDIRQMNANLDDVARRFVLLIDVLYDHKVKLICSAAVKPDQLYLGQRLSFEFERTASRLLEMQSQAYLAQARSLD